MVEEIFGPVLTAFVYQDSEIDATLDLVDSSTSFALTGAVFAEEREFLLHASERLKMSAGNLYINDKSTGAVVGQQPFGGSRLSGTNRLNFNMNKYEFSFFLIKEPMIKLEALIICCVGQVLRPSSSTITIWRSSNTHIWKNELQKRFYFQAFSRICSFMRNLHKSNSIFRCGKKRISHSFWHIGIIANV